MSTPLTASVTETVAKRLREYCNAGKYREAIVELYADDARHVEPMEMPGSPFKRISEGKQTLLAMTDQWLRTTTIHSASVGPTMVNDDQFVCEMKLDCTSNEGPMAGQRMKVTEQCLYTVREGKIAEVKFFYDMSAGG